MNPAPLLPRPSRGPTRPPCAHCAGKALAVEVHFPHEGVWYWYDVNLNCPKCSAPNSGSTPMWTQAIDDAAWRSRQSSVGHELHSLYDAEDVPVELAFRVVSLKPPGA